MRSLVQFLAKWYIVYRNYPKGVTIYENKKGSGTDCCGAGK